MVNGLILFIQVGLLALLLLLAVRVISLVRSEPIAVGRQEIWPATRDTVATDLPSNNSEWPVASRRPVPEAAPDRAELITRLHILAGLQERDCRVKGLVLATAPDAVKAYATAWLYGAGCALSDKGSRCPDQQSKNGNSSTGGDAGDQCINRQCGLSGLFPGGSGRCGVLAIQPFRTAHVESLRRHYCQRVYLEACLFAVSSTQSVPRATGSA